MQSRPGSQLIHAHFPNSLDASGKSGARFDDCAICKEATRGAFDTRARRPLSTRRNDSRQSAAMTRVETATHSLQYGRDALSARLASVASHLEQPHPRAPGIDGLYAIAKRRDLRACLAQA